MSIDGNASDVLVLGAGAIGLTLAYELACRGKTVTVIDRDPLSGTSGRGSSKRAATSWAASGILPPANFDTAIDPIDQLRGFSHQLFPKLAAKLLQETGIDCQLDRCGGWYLADTFGEMASMTGMVSYWREMKIECEEVTLRELSVREPALSDWAGRSSAKAWWVPDEFQIRAPRFLTALAKACRLRGVRFVDEWELVSFDETMEKVSVTVRPAVSSKQSSAANYSAGQVALCGGVWTGMIHEQLRLSESIVPVRGQILLLKPSGKLFSSIVNLGHRYVVPRRDGLVLVGSCEEEVGFDARTTETVLDDLRQFARQLCPQLSDAAEVTAWSGLRPMTFDGFPMIGKLPDSRRVYVAAGHFRSGIHLSPGTASCLADVMLNSDPMMSLDAFRVGKQQAHAGPV